MISCYLSSKSPQSQKYRTIQLSQSSTIHLTCKQANDLKIHYDDIYLNNKPITKIFMCGIILSYRQGISPMKKPIRIIKLKDNTGIFTLQVFQSRQWDILPQYISNNEHKKYVTIFAQAKCQGQFKYQIKLTVISMNIVNDYNQISLHMMGVIKDYIKLQL